MKKLVFILLTLCLFISCSKKEEQTSFAPMMASSKHYFKAELEKQKEAKSKKTNIEDSSLDKTANASFTEETK